MSRGEGSKKLDLDALLANGKVLPRQPDAVRARVLARARAATVAPVYAVSSADVRRARFPRRLFAPAAAVAVAVAGSVYALSGHWSRADAPTAAPTTSSPPAVRTALSVALPDPVPESNAAPRTSASSKPTPEVATGRTRRAVPAEASYEAELELMRSAHTAYATRDYANALVLVGEHERRFPRGVLAEEREALRVRCLAGSGRLVDARRAGAAFAKRFPRSVLLSRIQALLGGAPE